MPRVDRTHRDLIIWQKARRLAGAVYLVTQHFPAQELHGLTSQARRAAISIISNISEGAGRCTDKDMLHYLYIARGSILELEAQMLLATDLKFLSPGHQILEDINELGRLSNGLIRAVPIRVQKTRSGRHLPPAT